MVNPAMGMMLCSSMLAFEKVYYETHNTHINIKMLFDTENISCAYKIGIPYAPFNFRIRVRVRVRVRISIRVRIRVRD